jgi:hypothetical protein
MWLTDEEQVRGRKRKTDTETKGKQTQKQKTEEDNLTHTLGGAYHTNG